MPDSGGNSLSMLNSERCVLPEESTRRFRTGGPPARKEPIRLPLPLPVQFLEGDLHRRGRHAAPVDPGRLAGGADEQAALNSQLSEG